MEGWQTYESAWLACAAPAACMSADDREAERALLAPQPARRVTVRQRGRVHVVHVGAAPLAAQPLGLATWLALLGLVWVVALDLHCGRLGWAGHGLGFQVLICEEVRQYVIAVI